MSDEPPPARAPAAASLFRLSLEQQRKRAKDLLAGLRAGDPDAIRRGQRHLPRERVPRLSDAQHVVARELGLPSWPRLKDHIRAMEQSRERIARGGVAPDRGMATLHLRCGSDIETTLKQAGFGGDFLEYSDPLCQGPVRDDPSWLDRRADFLAGRLGAVMGRSREQIAASLAAPRSGCAVSRRATSAWFSGSSTIPTTSSSWRAASPSSPRRRRRGWSWSPPRISPARPGSSASGNSRPRRSASSGRIAGCSRGRPARRAFRLGHAAGA